MSVTVRECCNECMWFGPVNQDGTMRKHRPATLEDKYGHPNKKQDMSLAPCPGSHKPFALFGCETVPSPAAPRYVVVAYGRSKRAFAVYDTVTELDTDQFTSRYAATDKARRLNEGEAPAPIAEPRNDLPKCIHGRHQYKTIRGHSIPRCEDGAQYGVWDSNDAGFLHIVDCAQDAVTWAAEQMDDEPDYELEVKAVCPDHNDQPGYNCESCNAEGCGAMDPTDLDACGKCRDCNPKQFD